MGGVDDNIEEKCIILMEENMRIIRGDGKLADHFHMKTVHTNKVK